MILFSSCREVGKFSASICANQFSEEKKFFRLHLVFEIPKYAGGTRDNGRGVESSGELAYSVCLVGVQCSVCNF